MKAIPKCAPDQAIEERPHFQPNSQLAQELAALRTNLGVRIIEVDIFAATLNVLNDPSSFGFTNTTGTAFDTAAFQTAYATDSTVDATQFVVANPGEYVFFDGVHPTAQTHAVWGDAALARVVPEPTTLAIWSVLGLGLVGVGWWHRRRTA